MRKFWLNYIFIIILQSEPPDSNRRLDRTHLIVRNESLQNWVSSPFQTRSWQKDMILMLSSRRTDENKWACPPHLLSSVSLMDFIPGRLTFLPHDKSLEATGAKQFRNSESLRPRRRADWPNSCWRWIRGENSSREKNINSPKGKRTWTTNSERKQWGVRKGCSNGGLSGQEIQTFKKN